jgi:thiol-disulfide isomerase/thioredoxin
MKRNSRVLVIAVVACIVFAHTATAQTNSGDTLVKYYRKLATSANADDKQLLQDKLYSLLQSNREPDWSTAQRFFYDLKKTNVADSIIKAGMIRFPEGAWVRGREVKKIYDATTAVEKEKAYLAWVKQFDPARFGKEDEIAYDYASNSVATAYAKEGNVEKAMAYNALLKNQVWRGEGSAIVAGALLAKGFTKEAMELFKFAMDNSMQYKTVKKNEPGAGFAASGLSSYATSYAGILYKLKDYNAALAAIQTAYENSPKKSGSIIAMYAKILMALNRNEEAFAKIDDAVKAGQASKEMKDDLKTLYVKVKGSENGYDEYLAGLNKVLAEKFLQDLPRTMLKTAAPAFALKDLDGNTVSSADLKGKIVIMDLWATWCGPCKRSFPAMQMAVNKFRNDPDVKFVFVHTWEHTSADTAIAEARKYITDNKYDFHVLMDLKDAKTGTNKVVESLNVTAIPTKFIIDKNGIIRFRLTGFEGGDDAAVEEISAMIQLAKKAS